MFPLMQTERLILREIKEKDEEVIYQIFSNEKVTQYYGMNPFTTREQATNIITHFQTIFHNKRGIRWAMERVEDQTVIGTIGFNNWSTIHHRAEIGYELLPEFWGKGYATEGIKQVVNYGFSDMNLTRIGAIVFTENKASQYILEKLGFQKEGILKSYMYQHEKANDCISYSLIKEKPLNIEIHHLKDRPQHTNVVAKMIYEEFVVKTKSTMTLPEVRDFFSKTTKETFPKTFVAILDEKCIGTVSIFASDYEKRPQYTPWLASLFVDEKYRGYGIAQQLIKTVLQSGYKEIYLKTESAGAYYQKRGWTLLEKLEENNEIVEIYKYSLL